MPRHFENTKNPEKAENPHDHQMLNPQIEQQQIGRTDREQINDSKEAEDIGPLLSHYPDPNGILDGKENRKDPLQTVKHLMIFLIQSFNALEHDNDNAQPNQPKQHNIKSLACPVNAAAPANVV